MSDPALDPASDPLPRNPSSTHDWRAAGDLDHLREIRDDAAEHAAGGVLHLALEVLAYAVDEATEGTTRKVVVTLHRDGSVRVEDDGRGTQVRLDDDGVAMVKPVMGTRDLRFYDDEHAPTLPDGRRRRGISVVAALSEWLVHTNRRAGHGWTQRYEQGVPVGPLTEIDPGEGTGTSVWFRPDAAVLGDATVTADELRGAADTYRDTVLVVVDDRR